MNNLETKRLLTMMNVFYPNYRPDNPEAAAIAWQSVFSEDNFADVVAGLNVYVRTNTSGFAPSPGQLIQCMGVGNSLTELSAEEAWVMVSHALSNGIYGFNEEYMKLPEDVQRAIGGAENLREWAKMEQATVQSVIHSNFLKAYRVQQDRKKTLAKLPKEMAEMIEGISNKLLTDK